MISKLIKFLELTNSPNQGEKLNAIDKANKLLKDNSLFWEDILIKIETNNDNVVQKVQIMRLQDNIRILKEDKNTLRNIIYVLIILIILLFILVIT